jgi:hypothetical protein
VQIAWVSAWRCSPLFRPAWQRRLSSRRLEPIENEERAFDPADLLESKIELGLPFVSGQFLQHRRRRDAAGDATSRKISSRRSATMSALMCLPVSVSRLA